MRDAIRQQFGAALDALEAAMRAVPEEQWTKGETWAPWYQAFHTLFWLDLYLGESTEDYVPPPPFPSSELERGGYPERAFTRPELLGWLDGSRRKLAERLETVATEEGARRTCRLHWGNMQALELLLYNMRHVQHHTGQLNWTVRQAGGEPGAWAMRAGGL